MNRQMAVIGLACVMGLAACGDTATTTVPQAPATTETTAATTTTVGPATTTTVPITTTAATTTTVPRTTTFAGPSAVDDLAAFLAAAEAIDGEIAEAAALFNVSFDEAAGTVSTGAIDAIDALDAGSVASLIPAGLTIDLETAALAVYADLESRVAALNGGMRYLNQGDLSDVEFTMLCLGLGSESKARFGADMAAARSLAASSPRPTAAADSEAAGVLAVRVETIRSMNWGCDSCGGVAITDPIPVDWAARTVVDGVGFEATFVGGAWEVLIYAC